MLSTIIFATAFATVSANTCVGSVQDLSMIEYKYTSDDCTGTKEIWGYFQARNVSGCQAECYANFQTANNDTIGLKVVAGAADTISQFVYDGVGCTGSVVSNFSDIPTDTYCAVLTGGCIKGSYFGTTGSYNVPGGLPSGFSIPTVCASAQAASAISAFVVFTAMVSALFLA
eukprot:m.256358 g.256358  ORF g.256358 m.256358 type:complete len:172 (-) comp34306_c0_seq1:204-719(-)